MPSHSDIVDETDFCRTCAGTGVMRETEYRPEPITIFSPCFFCRGTGRRTVLIFEGNGDGK
jgi:DnaJ-class molecular chaperone